VIPLQILDSNRSTSNNRTSEHEARERYLAW
jgi:hypothetical protein